MEIFRTSELPLFWGSCFDLLPLDIVCKCLFNGTGKHQNTATFGGFFFALLSPSLPFFLVCYHAAPMTTLGTSKQREMERKIKEEREVTVWLTSHNTTSTDLIAAGIRALSDREVLQLFGMYKVGATLLHM